MCDPEPPSAPQNMYVVSSNPFSILLAWEPPASDGGTPILGYTLESRPFPTCKWVPVVRVVNPQYEITHDLIEGQAYYFRLFAHNAAGRSEEAAELPEPAYAKLPYGKTKAGCTSHFSRDQVPCNVAFPGLKLTYFKIYFKTNVICDKSIG